NSTTSCWPHRAVRPRRILTAVCRNYCKAASCRRGCARSAYSARISLNWLATLFSNGQERLIRGRFVRRKRWPSTSPSISPTARTESEGGRQETGVRRQESEVRSQESEDRR